LIAVSRSLLSIIVAAVTCSPLTSTATDYFVSPAGNATSSGVDRRAPTSPRAALGKVRAGDSVIFLDGVYSEPLSLTRSGTSRAPITLRAQRGAVPVFRAPAFRKTDGLSADADISNVVIDGLWFEGWGEAGIGLSWSHRASNIVIRNCVADLNGKTGFAPYFASGVVIEHNIASRNGWAPDSWSSNFDIFAVKGASNRIAGNVSFHGVDTSRHRSDGNGYILDLSIDRGSAVFENNIGFLNGGSCISITDSGRAQLVGNICYANARYGSGFLDELVLADTCRPGNVSGVPVKGRPYTFSGLVLRRNTVAPSHPSKRGIVAYSKCGSKSFTEDHNVARRWSRGELDDPDPARLGIDRRAIGARFDFKCIKRETDPARNKFSFWRFAPDLDYIKRIGGIATCFGPTRTAASSTGQHLQSSASMKKQL
jgi:hypothetical protein